MPSITNSNHGTVSRRSYIASGPFNDHFFNYTAKSAKPALYNPAGTLTPVTSDSGLCPTGSILRETGRKLYPGVNPGITTLMVNVYDSQTLLKGYINPTLPLFSVFSTDKQYFIPNSNEPVEDHHNVNGDHINGLVINGDQINGNIIFSDQINSNQVNSNQINGNQILAITGLGYTSPINTVVQTGNKSSAVTINGLIGTITTNSESLAANTVVKFRLNNTSIEIRDFLMLNQSGNSGDMGNYIMNSTCGNGYADIYMKNITGTAIATSQIIQFVVIKIVLPPI